MNPVTFSRKIEPVNPDQASKSRDVDDAKCPPRAEFKELPRWNRFSVSGLGFSG